MFNFSKGFNPIFIFDTGFDTLDFDVVPLLISSKVFISLSPSAKICELHANTIDKKIVILGRSNIVGKPLALELIARNGTVTLCHSKTSNVGQETKNADIVVVAIGKPNYLKAENIKVGAFVIDVGINFVDGKIVGDVDFESSKGKVAAITPVPGGVGVVTNYCLVENILKTFKLQNKRK